MTTPILGTDSDHVDQNFPFYYSDNLWSILDDHSNTILAIDGYDNGIGLDHIFHGHQNSSSAKLDENRIELQSSLVPLEASDNSPCSLLHENSILQPAEEDNDRTNCELNSSVFLDQRKKSALLGTITDKGLPEHSINDYGDHNIFPTTLNVFENLCPILEENHDASDKELQGKSANHHNHDSSLSNCTLEGTSNESWQLLEETSTTLYIENLENSLGLNSNNFTEEPAASPAQATTSIDKGLHGKKFNAKTKEKNHKLRLQSAEKAVQPNGEEDHISKKQEHNAKEKLRRMKLNATCLALGALLPDHRRTKKRRSTPVMIDKALEYIPELEKEIEDLTLRKNNLLSTIEKQNLRVRETPQSFDKLLAPTVSMHEVVKGEVIIQIVCIQKDEETTVFSTLLQNVEAQGLSILSASTLHVCKERVCYHLHIQMNGSSLAADYIAILRERVISWLA